MYKKPLTVPFKIPHLQTDYKKPSKKSEKKKKKNPYLPTMSIKAIHFPSPSPLPNLSLTLTTIPQPTSSPARPP